MTDVEKEKLRESFQKPTETEADEKIVNVWTHEEMLDVARKILKRIGEDDKKL